MVGWDCGCVRNQAFLEWCWLVAPVGWWAFCWLVAPVGWWAFCWLVAPVGWWAFCWLVRLLVGAPVGWWASCWLVQSLLVGTACWLVQSLLVGTACWLVGWLASLLVGKPVGWRLLLGGCCCTTAAPPRHLRPARRACGARSVARGGAGNMRTRKRRTRPCAAGARPPCRAQRTRPAPTPVDWACSAVGLAQLAATRAPAPARCTDAPKPSMRRRVFGLQRRRSSKTRAR